MGGDLARNITQSCPFVFNWLQLQSYITFLFSYLTSLRCSISVDLLLQRYYVPFAANIKFCRTLQELWIWLSCMSYLWKLNVSSVLVFKLCKGTRLLSRLYCQTLLSEWLPSFFSLVWNNIHKMSCSRYMSICLHQ